MKGVAFGLSHNKGIMNIVNYNPYNYWFARLCVFDRVAETKCHINTDFSLVPFFYDVQNGPGCKSN